MLITTVHGQQIEINNIDTNHGYLLFSDKPVQIPSSFEHHCLRINLTEIDTIADYFEQRLRTDYHAPQVKFLYNKMRRELAGIALRHRNKRGLINIVGSVFKYLFGTLDENDRVDIQRKLETNAHNSVNLHELNDAIQLINDGMQKIQNYENDSNIINSLLYELMQFTEYIEDVEMGMQLSRLGLFNPKLLNYDKLENVNSQNILNIKTSTWINYNDNQLLIISHIPINFSLINTVKIIPYPDSNGYQLEYTDTQSYFERENKVYNNENKEINNECVTNIIKHLKPICNFESIHTDEIIKYIEPNTIVTWNLTQTSLKQNCQNSINNIKIKGNKMIKVTQCKIEINSIILSENLFKPEIDLTPLYTPLNITKIKTVKHNDINEMISQNNITLYIFMTTVIIILILLYLYLRYVSFNPFMMLYAKLKLRKNQNQNTAQQIEMEDVPLPLLYPSIPAQV